MHNQTKLDFKLENEMGAVVLMSRGQYKSGDYRSLLVFFAGTVTYMQHAGCSVSL